MAEALPAVLSDYSFTSGGGRIEKTGKQGAHYREDYPIVNPKLDDRPMFSDQSI